MKHAEALLQLLALSSLLVMPSAYALPTDRDQPIQIEADRVDIDEGKGVAIYRGKVVVTQGSIHMTADTVTITGSRAKADKIVAEGAPVTFRQTLDKERGVVNAEAKRAEYFTDEDTLILLNQARIWEGEREFRSDRIEYNRVKGTLKAGQVEGAPGGKRVSATIPAPKRDQPKPEPQDAQKRGNP